MKRWLLSGLALAIGLAVFNVSIITAAGSSNPYEPKWHGQCTWWAAEMRPDLAHYNVGYADTWVTTSKRNGYVVDSTPEVRAIVFFPKGDQGADARGHLGFVDSVTDNTHFHITEYNFPQPKFTLSKHDRDVIWDNQMQFIHTQGFNPSPPPPDPNLEIKQTLAFTFQSRLPIRNIQIESGSKFELRIDGNLIASYDRPVSWSTFSMSYVWVGFSTQHNVEITWWQRGSEAAPKFTQTWWPNSIANAAEPEPGLNDGLPVSYSTAVQPNPGVSGQPVYITVAASSEWGYTIDSIDVLIDGSLIGNVQGANGTVTWDTTNWVSGNHQINFVAHSDEWPGVVSTRSVNFDLVGESGGITPPIPAPLPADQPSLSSPGNGSSWPQSTDITLVWNAASNATQYKVELWGGPYSTMTPCDWQSGTSCHIGQMWPGTMSWHVKARNGSQESGWSNTWSFTIQETGPTDTPVPPPPSLNAPSLSSPGNGSSHPQSTDITLQWNGVSGATQYKVELWGGPYSTMTPCDWQSGTSCHIGQMWPGTMSWHVKARNGSQESGWSDTWSFTIQEIPQSTNTPAPPPSNRPSLSSPGNGSSWPQSTDITLSWNYLSGATQYKVELWGGPYSTMTPCDWQGGTSCHIGQMWPGTMSWHVKARNSSGQETDWSDTWSFVIQNP